MTIVSDVVVLIIMNFDSILYEVHEYMKTIKPFFLEDFINVQVDDSQEAQSSSGVLTLSIRVFFIVTTFSCRY